MPGLGARSLQCLRQGFRALHRSPSHRRRVTRGNRALPQGHQVAPLVRPLTCEQSSHEVAHEFLEVETGKGSDALDRLSRDVHFTSGLMAPKGAVPGC
jgi:hypothetical protein